MSDNNDTALAVPPDDGFGRLVWHFDRVLRWPEDALNLIAAAATMFLVLIGVYQIVIGMRDLCAFWDDELCIGLINSPMFGYIDMIELAMPILAIIGIAYCMRVGTHIRMDILIGTLKGRVLWSVETFVALVTFLVAVMLAYFAYNFFFDAFTLGDSTTDAEIDTWPSKLLVPLAFALLALRLVVQFLGALRLSIDPTLEPVGVIVAKDIAEQAQEEIREAMGSEGSDEAPR
ncbi:MAG: TRAP transporter small permease [Pseudomonadota bacterium]